MRQPHRVKRRGALMIRVNRSVAAARVRDYVPRVTRTYKGHFCVRGVGGLRGEYSIRCWCTPCWALYKCAASPYYCGAGVAGWDNQVGQL